MNAIGFCIQAVDDRITKLQTLRASLVECVPLMVDTPTLDAALAKAKTASPDDAVKPKKRGPYQKRGKVAAPAAPPKKPRALNVRKLGERPGVGTTATGPKVPAGQSAQAVLDGKATSVGGAMKAYIRAHAKFADADLLAFLQKDEDYAKLLEQASASAVPGNLGYWVTQGYLDRAGGNQVVDSTFTVTAAGKEWFNK
jgi:hypothetical protein